MGAGGGGAGEDAIEARLYESRGGGGTPKGTVLPTSGDVARLGRLPSRRRPLSAAPIASTAAAAAAGHPD